jgi:membrane-associated phospholipid phosphatase
VIGSAAQRLRAGWEWPSIARGPLHVGLALLTVFAVLTALVGTRRLAGADRVLMAAAKAVISPELDVLVGVISYLAAAEVSLLMMTLLALWLWRRGLPPNRAVAPLLFLLSLPIEIALKFTLDQPTPGSELYRRTVHYALLGLPTMQSFPSGHATRTAFMTVLIAFLLVRGLGAVRALPSMAALCVAALVAGWSRVYLGYHWPMDVIGGFALGAGVAAIAIGVLIGEKRGGRPADRSA